MINKSDIEKIEAQMLHEAQTQVLENADWLSYEQLNDKYGMTKEYLQSLRDNREIFYLIDDDEFLYPDYIFSQDGKVINGLKEIMAILSNKGNWGLAFWFESVNSYLDGTEPKKLLQSDIGKVIETAHRENMLIQHG